MSEKLKTFNGYMHAVDVGYRVLPMQSADADIPVLVIELDPDLPMPGEMVVVKGVGERKLLAWVKGAPVIERWNREGVFLPNAAHISAIPKQKTYRVKGTMVCWDTDPRHPYVEIRAENREQAIAQLDYAMVEVSDG